MRRLKSTLTPPLRTILPGCALEARDQWMPQYTQSVPVESSSTLFPPSFEFPGSPSIISGQTSLTHPNSIAGIEVEVEGSPWNSTGGKSLGPLSCTQQLSIPAADIGVGHMQLFAMQLPPSLHRPDINAHFAHDPSTPISKLSHNPYSVVLEQFRNAPWRCAQELEPKDPTTGQSVLCALLERSSGDNKIICRLCNVFFLRWDRAIAHLRLEHLDHRPFRCKGACRINGWYDNFRYFILGPA